MIIDIIVLWLLNLFSPAEEVKYKVPNKQKNQSNENEDLVGFFFGASPFHEEDKSTPINDDYDKGPDW